MSSAVLYIVASPIGNLEDITLRALRILKEVDLIYCEDTRVTKRLLEKYDIKDKALRSLNARTEDKKINEILRELESGKSVAYLSDAGTPGISDPGARLVARAGEFGARVVPIPGSSAFVTALSASGTQTNKFCFLGFLPQKKGRQTSLKEIAEKQETIILYEAPHRILKFLKEAQEYFPNKRITLARELTKIHEEFLRGKASELLKILEQNPQKQKGEFTVIVDNA